MNGQGSSLYAALGSVFQATQHNSRPSQSCGPRGRWEITTATVQQFCHENSPSHNWPPETMMNGKFFACFKDTPFRPSQSYGPRGTWETSITRHQRSKHKRNATQFPSESKLRSARDMGNYYNQTSTFQAPLYKSFLMRTPRLIIGRLKP